MRPRRKSKKLELAHCPPKCELIHLNRDCRDPNAPVARGREGTGSQQWAVAVADQDTIQHLQYPEAHLCPGFGYGPACPAASTGRNLVLLVRSGPVNRDSGGSVHILEDNAPVLISYFYDGAAPVEVFQNRSESGFYMGNSFTTGLHH